VTPFAQQAAHYRRLGLAAEHIAHPLTGVFALRPRREPPSSDGGHLAFLPGSRRQELRYHLPVMMAVIDRLRLSRPNVQVDIVAADASFIPRIENAIAGRPGVRVARDARALYMQVDAALVKSGTAVLEAALCGTPTVAMYIISKQLVWIVRNIFHFRSGFVTLPNLILGRESIRERLQEGALPDLLAHDLERLLQSPDAQLADFVELRSVLEQGTPLAQWAKHILASGPVS
jgi:lipid-A-disaccharide synthase